MVFDTINDRTALSKFSSLPYLTLEFTTILAVQRVTNEKNGLPYCRN
jgi:hypothetical protein